MDDRNERDEWLMAQVALGKRDSLEPLVRRYGTRLLTFIHHMVRDRHRSEELFQEVFLAVWLKRRLYQFPRPFKAWLYAIAVNKCRAAFRRQAAKDFALAQAEPADAAAPDPSPTDAAIATETAALVVAAVRQLPPQQRVLVVLRVWEGLSYTQIAEVLNRSEGTVRSHMHHGLAALRK